MFGESPRNFCGAFVNHITFDLSILAKFGWDPMAGLSAAIINETLLAEYLLGYNLPLLLPTLVSFPADLPKKNAGSPLSLKRL